MSRPARVLSAVLVVLGCAAGATPASAAPNTKPYTVVITPDPVAAGSAATMTATFSVDAGETQQLGSADLTSPFAVRSVSPSSNVVRNVIQLRNLNVQPGTSRTVSIGVDVPCAPRDYDWLIKAKQANDFSGPPGNDMTPTPRSDLTTTVGGGCALRFVEGRQPQDARVGQTITNTDFDPYGLPVEVEVIDGAQRRVTSSSALITIGLGMGSGLGTLSGARTVEAKYGVARFGDLSISARGLYTLAASSPGYTSTASDPFQVEELAVRCETGVDCTGTLSEGGSTLTAHLPANGSSGYLTMGIEPAGRFDCLGYTELSAERGIVDSAVNRVKTVTFVIDKRVMNASANNGVSFLEMCFGAPYVFTTKSGVPATPDPNGSGLYIGLLPDCGSLPCVSARRKDRAGNGIIVAQTPPGDPFYRP